MENGVNMKQEIRFLTFDDSVLIVDLNSLNSTVINKNYLTRDVVENIISVWSGEKPYYERLTPINTKSNVDVLIIPSFSCNYTCSYCYQEKQKKSVDKMSISDIDSIYEFCKRFCEFKEIELKFGNIEIMGGEPFLLENKAVINKAFQTWPESNFIFTTNGTFLLDFIPSFEGKKVNVRVSLDGAEHTHYRRRHTKQRWAYNRALEGIKHLIEKNIPTLIITVFNPECIEEYSEFFDIMDKLGWRKGAPINCAFIPEVDNGSDGIDCETVLKNINAYIELKKMDLRASYVDARKLVPGGIKLIEALSLANEGKYNPYRCFAVDSSKLTFMPNGNVKTCISLPDELGCIGTYKKSISFNYAVIEALMSRRVDKMEKCRECVMRVFCCGGCVATAADMNGNLTDCYCNLWENPVFLGKMEEMFRGEKV